MGAPEGEQTDFESKPMGTALGFYGGSGVFTIPGLH